MGVPESRYLVSLLWDRLLGNYPVTRIKREFGQIQAWLWPQLSRSSIPETCNIRRPGSGVFTVLPEVVGHFLNHLYKESLSCLIMSYFLSIGAIFKNESHALEQWLNHYIR